MFGTPADVRAGVLLLANPMMPDPNFKRTVVLIVEHGPQGSLGFVLTRPAGYNLSDVTDSFGPIDVPVYYGGPVELNTLHALHSLGPSVPGSLEVAPGIYWGGNVAEVLAKVVSEEPPESQYRFFLGYSGWSGGQLEGETEEKSWIITPAKGETLWPTQPEDLWRETLRSLGNEYAIVANFPEDPRLN